MAQGTQVVWAGEGEKRLGEGGQCSCYSRKAGSERRVVAGVGSLEVEAAEGETRCREGRGAVAGDQGGRCPGRRKIRPRS